MRPPVTLAGVEIERDVECVLRDGAILRADVYRPAATERELPVLLLRIPYGKDMSHDGTYRHPAWYAREGFVVVVQDVRGRYASEGTFDPFRHEGADGFDSVEWAARLPGANGRVGMYGASYPGLVQFLAAVEQPPALGAIAPAVTSADLYAHWMYEGGALNLAFVAHWAAVLALGDAARRRDTGLAARLREITLAPDAWFGSAAPAHLEPLREAAPYYAEWLANPEPSVYWDELGAQSQLERVHVPVLHIAGWYDIFLEGGLSAYRRLAEVGAAEQELILGPWAHYPWSIEVGNRRFPGGVGTGEIDDAQAAFFRRHLSDGDESVGHRVRYYVLFGDRWDEAGTWPPERATTRTLHLASDGSANGLAGSGVLTAERRLHSPPDYYQYNPALPVPALGGHSCCVPGVLPIGCADQTFVEQLPEMLVYTSGPCEEPLTIAGPVSVELSVSSDALSADYVARLSVVDRCGSWNVAEGIARVPRTTPGEVVRLTVSLRSVAVHVAAGNRLRLAITSGSYPTWDRNPQNGRPAAETSLAESWAATHVLYHDEGRPSTLTLTVVPE